MQTRISLLIILGFLASCSNYNNIQYASKNNQLITDDLTIVDFDNDKSSLIPIYHINDQNGICDTILFKDGTISLYRAGNKGSKLIDVKNCKSNKNSVIKLSDIESIKFSNGIIWPPIDRACDTLYLTNGKSKVLKSTYMSNIEVLGIDCTSEKNKTISTRLDDIREIHFSDNRIWMNRSYCDTITFYDDSINYYTKGHKGVIFSDSRSYYRVGNKGVNFTDLFNCETNAKISVKNEEFKEIKFANGEVWPSNTECDTVYTSIGEKLLLRGVVKDNSFLTGEENGNQNKTVSIRLVNIKSVDYANGTTWLNKDVNNKSKYTFYRVRRTLITIGSVIVGLGLALYIALWVSFNG